MLRNPLLLVLCFGAIPLVFSACRSTPAAPAAPNYESGGISIYNTSPDFKHEKGAYVFGSLRIEGKPLEASMKRFALVMEYGRDANANGILESDELLDSDRISDGKLPFTYRIGELTLAPGTGRAMHRLRIEFDGEEPFRYERNEQMFGQGE